MTVSFISTIKEAQAKAEMNLADLILSIYLYISNEIRYNFF